MAATTKTQAQDLDKSFIQAIRIVDKGIIDRMMTRAGAPARENLIRLRTELEAERVKAAERGSVDREWFQRTVRWLVEWTPDTDLTLIAALGRIARTPPVKPSR